MLSSRKYNLLHPYIHRPSPPAPPPAPSDAATAGLRFAPRKLRFMVLERDSWLCRYCRARLTDQTANIDHVLAWPEGLTVLLNLVACCRSCNQKKGRSYVIPHPVPGERWYR